MSFLRRLWAGLGGTEQRRTAPWHPYTMNAATSASTFNLSEDHPGLVACINVVSGILASLPPFVYRVVDGVRTEAPGHPVSRLTRAPNEHQTWPDWLEWMVASALLRGNGLSSIEYDGAGRPTALHPIPWASVRVVRLPSGRLGYDVAPAMGGVGRRYLDDEVLHLKDRADESGLVGRSRLSRVPSAVNSAMALQDWNTSQWQNGVTPSGAFKLATAASQDTYERLRATLTDGFAGPHNARRPMLLESGLDWQAMSVSPEDAEVLESRKFTIEEMARIFGVPPPLIQDYSRNTFTNATTAGLWFAQFTLTPWARKIEAEFSRSVFGGTGAFELTIDLSGLTRGDFAARWDSYAIAIDKGILDPAEIRQVEGWSPRPERAPHVG